MEFKTVLFDFDGTLANTLPLTIYGMQEVFRKYDGRTVGDDGIVAMFGPPEEGMIRNNFQHQENVHDAIDLYYRIYEKEHDRLAGENPNIVRLLHELHRQDIQTGVITGKSRRTFQISEKALGFKGLFQSVVTGDDVDIPKPDPTGVRKTLEKFDANPESSIYIGDSNTDIMAGKSAGIHTAAVQWLPVSQSHEFPAGPDFIWKKVDDFLNLLDKNRSKA
ncbi:HAD family hydrolase [Sporolactobacillus sp. Y61]|uniref:HAD family hydrolase n=1 Tax=Sporolactobacillus sp. Y61 TaxID=3160863 RepID=A0AAU8IDM2_9BACL